MTKIQEQNAIVEKHFDHLIELMQADPQVSKWLANGDYAQAARWLNKHPEGHLHHPKDWKPNGLARMIQGKLGSKAVVKGAQQMLKRKGKLTPSQLGQKMRRLNKELTTQEEVAQALNAEGIVYIGRGGEEKEWDGKKVSDYLRRAVVKVQKEQQPASDQAVTSKVERCINGNTLKCTYHSENGTVAVNLDYNGSDDSDDIAAIKVLLEQLKLQPA